MARSSTKSENYSYYECPVCGIVASMSEEEYFLRSELPEGRVFQNTISSLFITDSLAEELPWRQFRDLEAVYFPVLEEILPDDPVPLGYQPQYTTELPAIPASVRDLSLYLPVAAKSSELASIHPEFLRLLDDRAASCPISMDEILEYLRLEMDDSCPQADELEFVRTARVKNDTCWLWRFEDQVKGDACVTVWLYADGRSCIGYRSNTDGLTPEQYIYGEYNQLL